MSGINIANPDGVNINGVRLGTVARLVDLAARGLRVATDDIVIMDPTKTERTIALRVHRHREKMYKKGYTKDQILESMHQKMANEAQRLTGQKRLA